MSLLHFLISEKEELYMLSNSIAKVVIYGVCGIRALISCIVRCILFMTLDFNK